MGLKRECCIFATSSEDGAGHLAGWCFSSAISACKHLFFIKKKSTRHLVALIESAVKEWMKCKQCRGMLLSLQGTGSRCLVGGQAALCCWAQAREAAEPQTTGVWEGFQVKDCFVLVLCTFTHSSSWLLWKLGSQGNLWHGSDWILKVVFYVLSSQCGREKRFCYLLWLAPRVAGDNLSCHFFSPILSVHLSSLCTVPGLYLKAFSLFFFMR